jgi:hypothetical protein
VIPKELPLLKLSHFENNPCTGTDGNRKMKAAHEMKIKEIKVLRVHLVAETTKGENFPT